MPETDREARILGKVPNFDKWGSGRPAKFPSDMLWYKLEPAKPWNIPHTILNGQDKVLGNLNRKLSKIAGGSVQGLAEGAIIIMGAAEPMTPVKSGDLRNSKYILPPIPTPTGAMVEFGYTIRYAPYVHEMTWATFHAPGTQAKWFERAIREKSRDVIANMKQRAKR